MVRNEHAVEIQAPPEAVFPYLTEPRKLCRWVGGLKEFTPVGDGEAHVGARSRQQLRVAGRDWVFEGEVLGFEPGRKVVARLSGRGVEMTSTHALQATPAGTQLAVSVETEITRLFARLFGAIVAREGQRKLETDLGRLVELVESERETSS